MRILWIATKPPSPPRDGGRLASCVTIDALVAAGAEVTVVAPRDRDDAGTCRVAWTQQLVPAHAVHPIAALAGALRRGEPLGIARHRQPAVARAVAAALHGHPPYDVVHVEQVQAFVNAGAARALGVPCVLRAQNVESDAWAHAYRGVARWVRRRDASRLRRYEASALGAVDATVALSATDAARLRAMAPGATVTHVPPPAPQVSPGASIALAGDPACVWIGSGGWAPNADGLAWLVRDVWPAVAARRPGAHLHAFGAAGSAHAAMTFHPAPADIASAFDRHAILLLPLRQATGVRMRILDAWARGVPVVASAAAADGLEVRDGDDLLLANTPAAFADAVERLATTPSLRAHLVDRGRGTLRRVHDPAAIARRLVAVYDEAIARHRHLS